MPQYALCTPEDIRGITAVSASSYSFDDPIIKNCILLATTQIEKFCGRSFNQRLVNDAFSVPRDFVGNFSLYSSGGPVVGNSLIGTLDGEPIGDILSPLDADRGSYIVNFRSPSLSARSIRLSYQGGFPARDPQPAGWDGIVVLDAHRDLVNGCALQASYLANRMLADATGGGENKSAGMKSGNYLLTSEVQAMVADWVRPRYMGV